MREADHNWWSIFLITFHHLASIFWEWPGAVPRGLLFLTTLYFPSCSFLVLLSLSLSSLVLSLSFLCSSVSEALFALSFSFLSEFFFFFGFYFVHAKAALAYPYSRNESQVIFIFNHPKLSMRVFGPRNSAYALWHTKTYKPTHIYHAKSRLNTPVWDSLRSRASELIFCSCPLKPLIHPSQPSSSLSCAFFFFSGSHPNSISYQVTNALICFSWSSVSDYLFFSSCSFFCSPSCSIFFCVLSSAFLSSILQSLKLCLLYF